MKILVVNVGSTSLKFRLFQMEDESVVAVGRVERVGSPSSPLSYQLGEEPKQERDIRAPDHRAAIEQVLDILTDPASKVLASLEELDAIGFKPVHAKGIADSVVVTDEVIQAMEGLHLPGSGPQSPLHRGLPHLPAASAGQDPWWGCSKPPFTRPFPTTPGPTESPMSGPRNTPSSGTGFTGPPIATSPGVPLNWPGAPART